MGWTAASIRIANANFEYHNVIMLVLKTCSYPLILGQPFCARSSLWIVNHPDGAVECIAHSQDSSAQVFWQAAKEDFDYTAFKVDRRQESQLPAEIEENDEEFPTSSSSSENESAE